jgi:hypothetical protein
LAGSPAPLSGAETLDLSLYGLLMETNALPKIGALLRVQLRLPEMITGWNISEWRITGHVVHVKSNDGEPGMHGVGVQFHYYEPVGSLAALALADLVLPGAPITLDSVEDSHEIRTGG